MAGSAVTEKAALIAIPLVEVVGYVGVQNGQPVFRKVSDESGDCRSLEVYEKAEDALGRFFNVRRVRIVVESEPFRHPEEWGAIDG